MVVHFAVVNDAKPAIMAFHWLRATVDVKDREAAVAKCDARIRPYTMTVWTTVLDAVAHAAHQTLVRSAQQAGDAAHSGATGRLDLSTKMRAAANSGRPVPRRLKVLHPCYNDDRYYHP